MNQSHQAFFFLTLILSFLKLFPINIHSQNMFNLILQLLQSLLILERKINIVEHQFNISLITLHNFFLLVSNDRTELSIDDITKTINSELTIIGIVLALVKSYTLVQTMHAKDSPNYLENICTSHNRNEQQNTEDYHRSSRISPT